MLAWVLSYLSTILVGLALACLLGLIVWRMIRQRKRGETSCVCGCENCAMKGACHITENNE